MAESPLFFWGHSKDSKYAAFSQWYPCTFTDPDSGVQYSSSEHFMMHGQARLFNDAEVADAILATSEPREAKSLGRRVQGFDEELWEEHGYGIVVRGNLLKFGQNQELRALLLATGDAKIVEAAPNDSVWGIGMPADKARKLPEEQWRGRNLLGKALMEVRQALREQPESVQQEQHQYHRLRR